MNTRKRISIDQLLPGMFVVKLDRPWLKTPFLFHQRLIKGPEEIALLKRHGVREVVIDLAKGKDGAGGKSAEHDAAGSAGQEQPGTREPDSSSDGTRRLASRIQTRAAHQAYAEAQAVVDRVFGEAEAGTVPAGSSLNSAVTEMLTCILADRTSVLAHLYLRQMRRYDQTLSSHALDVCTLSLIFAVESGMSPQDRENIGLGALLHDIGYLRLPRNLFRKGNWCTQQERQLLRRHPAIGAAMVAGSKDLPEGARQVIEHHHERCNGSGFPLGLTGSRISPLSQLVGVADTYMSFVAPRDGQAPLIPHEAVKRLFLLGQNGEFETEIVELAVKSLGVYPIGSLVELNTGQRGIVVTLHPSQRLRPVIALVSDPSSDTGPQPRLLDLSDTAVSTASLSIVRCLDPQQYGIDVSTYLDACQDPGQP